MSLGRTIEEIKRYKFKIEKVKVPIQANSLSEMTESLGQMLIKFTYIIKKIKPDLIFVEGDRGEMLAGAISGAYLNIPIIHHGGGDISDSIDNN